MIKPDARTIPSQDEYESWCLHPVSQFVAASYAAKAQECRDRWAHLFGSNLVPADLDTQRKILSAQEECFRAFMESHYLDHLKSVDPETWKSVVAPKQQPPYLAKRHIGSY